MVITTVSFFETVVQKCVEDRFWYKTTANLRNSRSFVARVILLEFIINPVTDAEK
jgi:hypothetical protein